MVFKHVIVVLFWGIIRNILRQKVFYEQKFWDPRQITQHEVINHRTFMTDVLVRIWGEGEERVIPHLNVLHMY
jgi:hypothetical protein